MSDDPSSPMTHPEELLATYVGGSLEPSEREAVEAHLAGCDSCRREVRYAEAARAALLALPELEAPGLAREGLAALGAAAPADLAERRAQRTAKGWGERWQQWAWGAGLAAAAVVAAVFLFTGGLLGGGDQAGSPASDSQFGAAAEQPLEIVQGGDHDAESLDALARSLATRSKRDALLSGSPETARAAPGPEDASGVVDEVTTCVREGAALGPENSPTYLEESTYQGTPIYVGAFIVAAEGQGDAHLELVAVTRQDCQPVYFARQRL